MRIGVAELTDRAQTGRQIYRIVKGFWRDIGPGIETTLGEWFNFVRNIPYKEDPQSAEILARPSYLLDFRRFRRMDCKKKAILIASWLEGHGIPWRLVAVSERPDRAVHHVFPQGLIGGQWRNIDATYPNYKLFEPKTAVTYAEELPT
jgi:hypothetical protein